MRLAMLTGRKYTALVNNYSNWFDTTKELEKSASINCFDFLAKYNFKENINEQEKLKSYSEKIKIPQSLKIYAFDNGDIRQFPSPQPDFNNLLNYYCIDGASVLPVIALDIKKDDTVLDLCASPGGKTLVMLQSLLPSNLFTNLKKLTKMNKK